MTRHAISLVKMGITMMCREHTKLRDEFKAEPKGVIGDNTKIGPNYDVLATRQYGRYGIEVVIDAFAKDGSTSWIVTSRGFDRYLQELSTECTQPMHADIGAHCSVIPATNVHNQPPHLTATGMMDRCALVNERGNILLVWRESCRNVSRSRRGCLFFCVIQLHFENKTEEFLGIH